MAINYEMIEPIVNRNIKPYLFIPFKKDTTGVYNMLRFSRRSLYGWDDIPVDGCNSITPARDELPLDTELYQCIYTKHSMSWHVLELYKQILIHELNKEGAIPIKRNPVSVAKLYASFEVYTEALSSLTKGNQQKFNAYILGYLGLLLPILTNLDEVFNVINTLQMLVKNGEIDDVKKLPHIHYFFNRYTIEDVKEELLGLESDEKVVEMPAKVLNYCFDKLSGNDDIRYDVVADIGQFTQDKQNTILYKIADTLVRRHLSTSNVK